MQRLAATGGRSGNKEESLTSDPACPYGPGRSRLPSLFYGRGHGSRSVQTVLLAALLFLVPTAVAQHDISVRHFGTAHGLPHEDILTVAQTSEGRLWVGTASGFAYFDGMRFHRGEGPFPLAPYKSIVAADERSIWAAAYGAGVVRVDASGTIKAVEEISGVVVQGLLTRQDTLLVATSSSLWIVPPGRGDVQEYPFELRLPGTSQTGSGGAEVPIAVRAIVPVGRNTYWILDRRLGPGLWSPGIAPQFPGTDLNQSWLALHLSEDGDLWALSSVGLYRIDPVAMELEFVIPIPNNQGIETHDLIASRDGVVFVASDEGILRWNKLERRVLPSLIQYPSLAGAHARQVYHDHEGGLWIGGRNGLFYAPAPGIVHVREVAGQQLTGVSSNQTPVAGSPWMGTFGSGLLNLHTMELSMPDNHRRWFSMMLSQDGRSYVLGGSNRYLYERGEWQKVGPRIGSHTGAVDREGRAYLWTPEGLYMDDGTGSPERLYLWSIDRASYHAFTLAPDGSVVLRAGEVLLSGRLTPGPRLQLDTLAVIPQIADAQGRYLLADRQGRVWLTLWQDGLVVVEGGVARHVLTGVNVNAVIAVEQDLIIAATLSGIVGFDAETSLIRFSLGMEDGLLTGTAAGALFNRDTLVVAHPTGLTLIPRSLLGRRIPAPQVILEPKWADERQRSLEVQFLAATYRAPHRVQYEYQLNDDQWQRTAQTRLLLAGLPPGPNTVSVRARHEHGEYGPAATHAFMIPTPLYRTRWFTALVGMLAVGAIMAIHGFRLRVLRRRERELIALVSERTQRLAEAMHMTERQADLLRQHDELKTRFFTNISHEFRTPLTVVRGLVEDVIQGRHGSLNEEVEDRLCTVSKNTERLTRLVEDLLELSKLEAGQAVLHPAPGDLVATVQASIQAHVPAAERAGVSLGSHLDISAFPALFDSGAIDKIVSNLLSNAIKNTSPGGHIHLTLVANPGDSGITIEVVDDGTGITASLLPHIFDRFVLGEEEAGSSGIGLAMVKELVALHEGTIDVESEVGSGSCFTVSLPITRREFQGDGFEPDGLPLTISVQRSPDSGPHGIDAGAADAPLVLVVDDNPDIRAYVTAHLARQYHVREAADGADALALAREAKPALIISDVMMPGMSGEELCRQLRSDEALADVPVILLTARVGGTAVAHGLQSGADAYVEKPFNMDALLARIARLIASRESLKASYARRMVIDGLNVAIDSADAALLQQMFEIVEARIEESTFGVADLAAELGLSPRHLRRRINEATGQSPVDVLRRYRLERAARLLAAGAAGVSEVGYRVGYGSPTAFTAQFKKRFGMCPSEYAAAPTTAEDS